MSSFFLSHHPKSFPLVDCLILLNETKYLRAVSYDSSIQTLLGNLNPYIFRTFKMPPKVLNVGERTKENGQEWRILVMPVMPNKLTLHVKVSSRGFFGRDSEA